MPFVYLFKYICGSVDKLSKPILSAISAFNLVLLKYYVYTSNIQQSIEYYMPIILTAK